MSMDFSKLYCAAWLKLATGRPFQLFQWLAGCLFAAEYETCFSFFLSAIFMTTYNHSSPIFFFLAFPSFIHFALHLGSQGHHAAGSCCGF
jgi:hypothetical protein